MFLQVMNNTFSSILPKVFAITCLIRFSIEKASPVSFKLYNLQDKIISQISLGKPKKGSAEGRSRGSNEITNK